MLTAFDTSGNESAPSLEKQITLPTGTPQPLARSGWGVWVDSEETAREQGQGTNIKDGNNLTLWHTQWSGATTPLHPHHLVVDVGAVATIAGFSALPRQDGGANGRIGQWELYVKTNSATPPTQLPTNRNPAFPAAGEWTLVDSGTFLNSPDLQTRNLPGPVSGRYVWLRVLSEAQGINNPWTSLAEFNVLGTMGGASSNKAPTVSAGANQTITLPSGANLTGTVTDDGLPNPPQTVTTTWSKVSGPGTVTFGNADAVATTATFSVAGTYVLQLTATDNALSTSAQVTMTVNPAPASTGPAQPLARSSWVISVDSQETTGEDGRGINVKDGKTASIWHTEWFGAGHPHDLVVDVGAVATVAGFKALPRQDGGANGMIGNWAFYVKINSSQAPTLPLPKTPLTLDPAVWKLVASSATSGAFPNSILEQTVLFGAETTRYVVLRALSVAAGTNSGPWTSLAEFNVLGTP